MRRRLTTTLGALAATASLALVANSFAQSNAVDVIVPSEPTTEQISIPTALPTGHIEGRVADIEPTGDSTRMLRLEDGTRLIVLASANGPEVEPRPGDIVKASYLELDGEKLVTSLRAEVEFQAP